MNSRYQANGDQAEFEPGSNDSVLRNLLGIGSTEEMADVELILIHPFRDGNGRLARLLADVMAVQAGHGLLDYSPWDQDRQKYFAAIQRGMAGEYQSMQDFFLAVLKN